MASKQPLTLSIECQPRNWKSLPVDRPLKTSNKSMPGPSDQFEATEGCTARADVILVLFALFHCERAITVNIPAIDLLRAPSSRVETSTTPIPPEVLQLFPREREIALVVYNRGLATAKDIEAALDGRLSNAAIRSMLNRLVRKGILYSHRYGRRRTLLYAAALSEAFAREMALKQFAADFCRGSISSLASEIADLLAANDSSFGPTDLGFESLPPQVQDLFPRMREIATIVYLSGGTTVRDVQSGLSDEISVYGIRTMLGRMVKRGIVKRRRSGRHSEIVYLPGFATREVRRIALRRFIDKRFGGSPAFALQIVLQLMRSRPEQRTRRRRPTSKAELALEVA